MSVISPVLLVPRVAPQNHIESPSITTGPHISARTAGGGTPSTCTPQPDAPHTPPAPFPSQPVGVAAELVAADRSLLHLRLLRRVRRQLNFSTAPVTIFEGTPQSGSESSARSGLTDSISRESGLGFHVRGLARSPGIRVFTYTKKSICGRVPGTQYRRDGLRILLRVANLGVKVQGAGHLYTTHYPLSPAGHDLQGWSHPSGRRTPRTPWTSHCSTQR
jgi:hypothetical protein